MSARRFMILSFCLFLVVGFCAKTTLAIDILYIENGDEFQLKDQLIRDYMTDLGHTVIPLRADEDELVTEVAAEEADIVFISETVSSGQIKNEITEIDVPMIINEP